MLSEHTSVCVCVCVCVCEECVYIINVFSERGRYKQEGTTQMSASSKSMSVLTKTHFHIAWVTLSVRMFNRRRFHSPLSLFSITSTVSPALRLISEFSCLS